MLVAPPKLFLALFEAGEIAAAGRAAIGRGAKTQLNHGPAGRAIILLTPGGKFLAIAFWTAREFPGRRVPDASFPAGVAPAAAERGNSRQSPHPLREPCAM